MQTPTTNNPPAPPATQGWVRFRSVGYLIGRGLAFGIRDDLFPRVATAPGKFSINTDIMPSPLVTVCDGRLDIFADDTFDHVAVGPSLGMAPNPAGLLRDLTRKLRRDGHLVLYLQKNHPDQNMKYQFEEESLMKLLAESGAWRLKYRESHEDDMLVIAKKIGGQRGTVLPIKPKATKRACIVRYGALGDMVMITPLIRKLHEDGYEVTMNITPYAAPLLDNNPYVSNIVFQEREAIPNKDLGPYWDEWRKDYDCYINLSESIEGKLLKVEGRRDFFTSAEWRRERCGSVNYYDHTMTLGGYPNEKGLRGELFFSPTERKEAMKLRRDLGTKFVVAWGVNGSSHHKVYPLMKPVLFEWLAQHPDVTVYLLGGPEATRYEFDHPQVVKACGAFTIRQTLAFIAHVADAVIGPESMITNVAACYDVPKITFLSHSTHENLCKYWTNDFCMTPDTSVVPCYPCHQLHYTLESCPQAQMQDISTGEMSSGIPLCAVAGISGYRVKDRLEEVYQKFCKTPQPTSVEALTTV